MRGEVTGLQLIAIRHRHRQSGHQVSEKQSKNIWQEGRVKVSLPSLKLRLSSPGIIITVYQAKGFQLARSSKG
jgi:hypothetical protein